jgi:phosphopantetheine adenylyltransferase
MANDEPARFLLLVPPTPSPPSLSTLKATLGDTISQVLKEVATASTESSKAAILEIALACPHLAARQYAPRSELYDETQAVLAGIYKLVCIIALAENINVEDADGVDVRVLLVAWAPDVSPDQKLFGPVVSLELLARSSRAWQYAFGVESEMGEALVRAFVTAKGSHESVSRPQGGPAMITTPGSGTDTSDQPMTHTSSDIHAQRHFDVAVGGTFDHLHIGHKLLLTMTLFAADQKQQGSTSSATIGITGDQLLVNKKHASVLESWSDRQNAVESFCDSILDFTPSSSSPSKQATRRNSSVSNGKAVDLHYHYGLVLKCTEIQDPFGPTITDEAISALVISAETRSGGMAVNEKRKGKGWRELDVFEVDVLDAEEGGAIKDGFESKLSSTAIREKIARKIGANM